MSFPDVVVGVDFGMTSTGVAYSAGPEWTRPETIQNWPGNQRGAIADKVDTKIAYDAAGNIVAWGFMVNEEQIGRNYQYEELFKLYLDPDFDDPYEEAPSLQQARTWFSNYLMCVYQAVNRHLSDTIPRYAEKRVEFRFSVPTTWKNPAMIAETEQLIRNAGFGQRNPNHVAEISLTEAEAAAVYASKQQYRTGDVFMVCDAGGGTSDVNILNVVSSGVGETELEPLSWVEGKAVGSTMIDYRIEKMIAERLRSVRRYLTQEPDAMARQMLRHGSRFESFKCNFGDEAMNMPALRLDVPGLPPRTDLPGAHIENSQMIILKDDLQKIFDIQIEKIIALIDDQLKQLETKFPDRSVAYLVLSGGFGSSPYLQQRLRERYEGGKLSPTLHDPYNQRQMHTDPSPRFGVSPHSMQVLKVPKPQIAVCHGLVLDRVQQIKQNRVIYKERFSRNSYGIVVRKPWDPNLHTNEVKYTDPLDHREWAVNQIDWLIEQGQKVSVRDGIKHHYSFKVREGHESELWHTQIVMSTLPADKLPTSMRQPGANRLCTVDSELPKNMKVKNRHWYNTGAKYRRAEFDIQVIVGAADLKFQTLDQHGVLSQDHESIAVEWVASRKEAGQPKVAELDNNELTEMRQRNQKWRTSTGKS